MIEIVLCDWYLHPTDEIVKVSLISKIAKWRKLGYMIRVEWSVTGLRKRFVATFENEEEAALFKLTHL